MSEKTIKLVVSYGQSLSVGAEGLGALSTEAQFPENALMLQYIDRELQYDDWGAIGPKGNVFDSTLVSGFTSLRNYKTESHTTSMINRIISEYQDAGEDLPTILNISSGSSGKSIEFLSDENEIPYNNLIGQIGAAYEIAKSEGYEVDPEIVFYWKQGSANSNMNHLSYAEALRQMVEKLNSDISLILGEDSSIKFFNDIGGRKGSAWGNLDFVLSTNNSYLAGESQWDTSLLDVGGVFTGVYGGHKSNSAYFIKGSEAGISIADALLGNASEHDIILISAVEVFDNVAVVTFSGLKGHLVVDSQHRAYATENNSVDLGFFAYLDAGRYTGSHVSSNAVVKAEIVGSDQVRVTFEQDIEKDFYLGIGGGDGGIALNMTPLRDSVTDTVINYSDDPDIDMFNDEFGGIKSYVTYHYVKIGPSGLVKSAYEIAGAEKPVVLPDASVEEPEDALDPEEAATAIILSPEDVPDGDSRVVLQGTGDNNVFEMPDGGGFAFGYAGKDRIYDGVGDDYMVGGTGADLFVFKFRSSMDPQRDTIADLDFSEGDRIKLIGDMVPQIDDSIDPDNDIVIYKKWDIAYFDSFADIREAVNSGALTVTEHEQGIRLGFDATPDLTIDLLNITMEDVSAIGAEDFGPALPPVESGESEDILDPEEAATAIILSPEDVPDGDSRVVLQGTGDNNVFEMPDGGGFAFGYGGKDRIYDGVGDDYMVGGTGADLFVFKFRSSMDPQRDTIADLDFSEGDRIKLIGDMVPQIDDSIDPDNDIVIYGKWDIAYFDSFADIREAVNSGALTVTEHEQGIRLGFDATPDLSLDLLNITMEDLGF